MVKACNPADFSWLGDTQNIASNKAMEGLLLQVTVPVRRIFWKDVSSLVALYNDCINTLPYTGRFVKSLLIALKWNLSKGEKRIHHFKKHDQRVLLTMKPAGEMDLITCIDCKKET